MALWVASAMVLIAGCATSDGGPTGQARYDKIVAQATAIRPPALRDLPPASRGMFGRMHSDPDYVAYRCEYALNPDGSPCDVSAKIVSESLGMDEVVRTMAYNLNFGRSGAVDAGLVEAGLKDRFKYASGEQGNAVRVFGASAAAINFLVEHPWGTMTEIKAAAADYCKRQGRGASFVGAAQACLPPRSTRISVGVEGVKSSESRATAKEQGAGKDKVWETWVLVSFDCVERTAAQP